MCPRGDVGGDGRAEVPQPAAQRAGLPAADGLGDGDDVVGQQGRAGQHGTARRCACHTRAIGRRRVHQGGDIGIQPLLHDPCRQLRPSCLPPWPRHQPDLFRARQAVPHLPVQPLARGRGRRPTGLLVRLGEPQPPRRAVQQCENGGTVRHVEIRGAPGGCRPVHDAADPGTRRARGRYVEQHVARLEVLVQEPPFAARRGPADHVDRRRPHRRVGVPRDHDGIGGRQRHVLPGPLGGAQRVDRHELTGQQREAGRQPLVVEDRPARHVRHQERRELAVRGGRIDRDQTGSRDVRRPREPGQGVGSLCSESSARSWWSGSMKLRSTR